MIAVIIVISILAGIALVRYTKTVEKAQTAEGKHVLLTGYAGYQRLLMDGEAVNASDPLSWSRMGMSDPMTMANKYFSAYTIQPNANAPTTLRAVRQISGCGSTVTQQLDVNLSDGNITEVDS